LKTSSIEFVPDNVLEMPESMPVTIPTKASRIFGLLWLNFGQVAKLEIPSNVPKLNSCS
jgi:hypothetical protein